MARHRRNHGEEAHENAERWLLTYADMITLLMVLFVVMYAISNTDLRKFTVLAQSFSAAFNTDVFQGQQALTVTDGQQTSQGPTMFDAGQGVIATDYRSVTAFVADYAIANGLANEVSVDRVPEGIAIRINEALLFSSGRARLDARALEIATKIASIIAPLPNNIRVEGHTDDQPPTGPFYVDNWELSTARAVVVLDALRDHGIAPERLAAAGYAGYQPLVPNTTDANRARNRRVDILILYPPAPSAPPTMDPLSIPSPVGGQP